MNLTSISIAAALGILVSGFSVYTFMEKKIEQRVLYETRVIQVQSNLDTFRSEMKTTVESHKRTAEAELKAVESAHSADDKANQEKLDALIGRIWTIEQEVGRIDKAQAIHQVKHP